MTKIIQFFGPTKLLDFELEMGFITFDGKSLGEHISTDEADNYILECAYLMIGQQEIFKSGNMFHWDYF